MLPTPGLVLLLLHLGNHCLARIKFINLDNAIVSHLNPPEKHRIYISLLHSLSFFNSLARGEGNEVDCKEYYEIVIHFCFFFPLPSSESY